jgi:hypothetical protein
LANAMAGKISRQSLDLALQSLSQGRWLLEQWQRALEYYRQLSERDQTAIPTDATTATGEQDEDDNATESR